MKKLLFVCLMAVLCAQAQSQTTMEEYKYCIAGYRDVLTKGADGKAGYTMSEATKKTYSFGSESTTVWVRKLVKDATKKVVGYCLIYQLGDKANEQSFYCIPHPNSDSEIMKQFREDIGWINTIEANSIYKLRSILFAIVDDVKW